MSKIMRYLNNKIKSKVPYKNVFFKYLNLLKIIRNTIKLVGTLLNNNTMLYLQTQGLTNRNSTKM